MEQHPVELCIDTDTDADTDADADADTDHDGGPIQSHSLESSVSTYDSIMQSLHEELNSATPPNANFDTDFAEFDFFNMDCATAISFDYEMNYTMKQLKHIAGYYGLKCKTRKADMIQDIVLFETDDKNGDAVGRRKRLFHYMDTLKNDEYLKSYVIM